MPESPAQWRYTPDQLRLAVARARSYRQVLARLGLSMQGGGAYATLHRRIAELGLDTSHFTGQGWNVGNPVPNARAARPLEDLLVEHSDVRAIHRLKHRLIKQGILENRCQLCGLADTWNGAPIVLRLDHVNGTRTDYRLENLRLVCPNCDSQLPTLAGRNKRGKTTARAAASQEYRRTTNAIGDITRAPRTGGTGGTAPPA